MCSLYKPTILKVFLEQRVLQTRFCVVLEISQMSIRPSDIHQHIAVPVKAGWIDRKVHVFQRHTGIRIVERRWSFTHGKRTVADAAPSNALILLIDNHIVLMAPYP